MMPPTITVVHSLTEAHLEDLCELYRISWWAEHRTPEQIRKMLSHSDILVGLVDQASGRLVGFSRLLTDFVYRATIYDVLVAESHQGQGLGRQLIDTIVALPELQAVEQITLYCKPDMVPFYEKWDFSDHSEEVRLMHRQHVHL